MKKEPKAAGTAWTTLHVGYNPDRVVTQREVRNAQKALINDKLGDNDRALIDAIIAHFVCGRETKWQ